MRKKICIYAITVILTLTVCHAGQCIFMQRSLSERLIRLHVVANSDFAADQDMKLHVRDAVLYCMQDISADCTTRESAFTALSARLDSIETAAEATLLQAGQDQPVCVSLCRERFPTRHYDTFDLPAGEYDSLRVSIGAGEGHNWWCVVFPSLCAASTTDGWTSDEAAAAFSESERDLMAGGEEEYEIRFKTLEYLERFWNWITE